MDCILLNAGDLAQVDLNRLELQRVQFESDYETAVVNLRTNKIQLLMLLNDRTPLERFDVAGSFDFVAELKPLEDFRKVALESRPDLKAAAQNVELARISHQLAIANGATDPTFSFSAALALKLVPAASSATAAAMRIFLMMFPSV